MWRATPIFLIALIALGEAAWGCPTCSDGLHNDAASANLIRGYFWSIVFMMSMPFLIFGSFGAYMYYEVRKARASKLAAEPISESSTT